MEKVADKKVLFVLNRASLGGSTSSLVNLLSLYKNQGIVFDVFLMAHDGARTSDIAQYANLLPEDTVLSSCIKSKDRLKGLGQYAHRIKFILCHKMFGYEKTIKKVYQDAAKTLSGRYETVIAYQENEATRFVQYIEARNRITWMHTDFELFYKNSENKDAFRELYSKYDHIVCVTKSSEESVKSLLNRSNGTVHCIRNTLPTSAIREKSKYAIPEAEQRKKHFMFISVGRFSHEKAFERIPEVSKILIDRGHDFEWVVLGDGSTYDDVKKRVEVLGVTNHVRLLGSKQNPYPYINAADCLVITSRYEAQPMVANEALILDTPVISTEYASAKEVITNYENGLIVSQSAEDIAEALSNFMNNKVLRDTLKNGAFDFVYSNENEIKLLNNLIER